jgi:hypothetical protein
VCALGGLIRENLVDVGKMNKRNERLEFEAAAERLAKRRHQGWKQAVCTYCELPSVSSEEYGDLHPLCWHDPQRQRRETKKDKQRKQSESLF